MSQRNRGRYAEVMEVVVWETERRHERGEDPTKCVTTLDLVNVAARAASILTQDANMVAEERRANMVFGDRLA